jgi:hypothetical protein
VPPAPDTLFSIHAVADDGTTAWMHTHGLARCGTLELEALDVPVDFTGLTGQLINTIAAMILEHGIPAPGEVFEPGRNIDVAWMPWFEGIKKVKRSAYGRRDGDRDDAHRGARGILLVPRKGWFGTRWRGLDTHRPVLEDNPVLFVSSLETLRHKLLAKERQGRFRALFERFSNAERWVFLIKLGYIVDGAEDESAREHLWFRVHGIDDARVDATLVNEPHQIARMHEGDRAHHDLALMSSWVVLCEHGKFDPESIGILERKLAHEAEAS